MQNNPCLECGACCAYYRASFYWAEANDTTDGGVPVAMTSPLNDFRRVMNGTDQHNPRCVALMGIIGKRVHCLIYQQRSSTCREFPAAWEYSQPNERCDKARAAWGMAPLSPSTWESPENFPKAA